MKERFPFSGSHRPNDQAMIDERSQHVFGDDVGEHRICSRLSDMPQTIGEEAAGNPAVRQEQVHRVVYIPERYDPHYAYPLIVWLHPAGASERDLFHLMPELSTQNFIAIAFRGTLPPNQRHPAGYGWSRSEMKVRQFEQQMYREVCNLRREYHIHSERIFLAGFDDGAGMAIQLLLNRPDWFAGAIALSGRLPARKKPLVNFRKFNGKRVLIGTGTRGECVSTSEVMKTGRLLHSAGMDVTTKLYDAGHEITGKMLSHWNHWLIESTCAEACIC